MGSLFVNPLTLVLSSFKWGRKMVKKSALPGEAFWQIWQKKVFYEFVGAEPIRLRARSIR